MASADLTRRTFLTAAAAAGGAVSAGPVTAGAVPDHVTPRRHAPVRATFGDLPYFDFTGQTQAYRPARARPLDAAALTPEQRWLLGLF